MWSSTLKAVALMILPTLAVGSLTAGNAQEGGPGLPAQQKEAKPAEPTAPAGDKPAVAAPEDDAFQPSKEGITPLTRKQLVAVVPNCFVFDYGFQPQPGKRVWLRINDRYFAERYPDGTENLFLIVGHGSVRGVTGTIVSRVAGTPEKIMPSEKAPYQTFIPDKGDKETPILCRWYPEEWRTLGGSPEHPGGVPRNVE